ncbi:hypothetical protein CPter291_1924 [Collimonas pratensis]|uniref:Transposase n=1 Tax=Collimonas pratensis TaxID=279113 RepID=A0ABM5Z4V7_9BURK|nr:hypothetical protein CPter291_1924 [Collimonas pratensis]
MHNVYMDRGRFFKVLPQYKSEAGCVHGLQLLLEKLIYSSV